jgi:phosphoserine phosphatase RsbU/P
VPLGIKSDTEYPEKDIFIRPGDKLLFFTDGCVEQKDDKGNLLGDRRFLAQFKKLAAAHRPQIPRELYRFVLDYSNHGQITDDIAILLAEFNNTKRPSG